MSGPVRIVRKVDQADDRCAFWLNATGEVCGCWEIVFGCDALSADKCASAPDGIGDGWKASDNDAAVCGTTLSALHQELTEGGEG
jgi:hypothetical protein